VKQKKIERVGDIMFEQERVAQKLVEQHDMQASEIVSAVLNYLEVHYPGCFEEFTDGSRIVFLWGHKEVVKKKAEKL
jgi:hypothetical protein